MADGVEILSDEAVYQGHFEMRRYRLRHRLHAGGMTGPLMRECFMRPPAVGILPYDPVRDRVVLVEQFRVGALAAGLGNPWLLEIPAGVIDHEGESPEAVALRELAEETGLDTDRLEKLATYLPSPGGMNEYCHVFCARVDSGTAAAAGGLASENEDLKVLVLDAAEALVLLDSVGRIENSVTLIALGWLGRHRARLRRDWAAP